MLRIALLQHFVTPNKLKNIAKAVELIEKAAKKGAELVVLPECFNGPYGTKYFPTYAEVIPEGETCIAISKAARDNNIAIIAGTIPEAASQADIDSSTSGNKIPQYFNTCPVFDPMGKLVGKYRKMHLFRIHTPTLRVDEREVIQPGGDLMSFEYKNFKIGIGICFDVRFPTLALEYARNHHTDLLVFPSAFNLVTGPAHWNLVAKSRALDAQQYVAMCSPARDSAADYVAYGHSLVVDPWGSILSEADEGEEIVHVTLSKDQISDVRCRLPILSGFRSDVYDIQWKGGLP